MTPPTDSIYKFLAISGLVLIIWGLSFPETKKYELAIDSEELYVRIEGYEDLMDKISMRTRELVGQIEKLEEKQKSGGSLPELDKAKSELQKELYAIDIRLAEAKLNHDIDKASNEIMQKAVVKLTKIGNWSFWAGLFLVLTGFVAWYIKLQRFIDLNVKEGKNP